MSILRSLLQTSTTVPSAAWLPLISSVNAASLHTNVICCAAVKKTAAAGGRQFVFCIKRKMLFFYPLLHLR